MSKIKTSQTYEGVMFTGKNPSDEYLEGMMSEAPGPINFTMFLTMFGERLNGTDPEDVIRNAFACFDEEGSGECVETLPFSRVLVDLGIRSPPPFLSNQA